MRGFFLNLLSRVSELLFQSQPSLTSAVLWGMILYLICLPLFFRKKELSQNLCIAVLFLYAAAVLRSCGCLAVPTAKPDMLALGAAFSGVEWNPFLFSPFGISGLWTTLLYDFLALLPVGFLIPLTSYRTRLWKAVLLSLLCGFGLEVLRLLANVLTQNAARSVSTGEAILSAAGCLTGYLIFSALRKLPLPARRARHYARPGHTG